MKLQIFLFRKKQKQTAHIHGKFGPGRKQKGKSLLTLD